MTRYLINTETSNWPATHNEVMLATNTTFSSTGTPPDPYAWVELSDKPIFNSMTETVVESDPLLIENSWTQQWAVESLTQTQIDANIARAKRDLISDYTNSLERWYDTVAQVKQYDNRLTCALRAGYAGPFQTEGLAFAIWMDDCNAYGYTVLGEVETGVRSPMPTWEELKTELPTPPWTIPE